MHQVAWDVINQKIGMKEQEVITLQRAHSFLAEWLYTVLGSANYALGPAFQLLYRQGKLLPTRAAEPSCSRLFSCHCDCNLRQNIILHFLKPRRKDVKVGGKKRHTYFGSKATKKIQGVLPILGATDSSFPWRCYSPGY